MTTPVEVNPLQFPTAEYRISKSLMFARPLASFLYRNPIAAGNRRVWTFSTWVKRGGRGGDGTYGHSLFSVYDGSLNSDSGYFNFSFQPDHTLRAGGWSTDWRISSAKFTDSTAWYHIMLAVDTTNATAQNRMRMYVNGEEITAWGTNNTVTQNLDLAVCGLYQHRIGNIYNYANWQLEALLADTYLIDNQQLTPSSFGYNDPITGQWMPKEFVTTSYGRNGFYFPYSDVTNLYTLGHDFSEKASANARAQITGSSGAVLRTDHYKFGTASYDMGSKSTRRISIPDDPEWRFYNKDYTLEFWYKGVAANTNFGSTDGVLTGYNYIVGKGRVNTGAYGWGLRVYSNGAVGINYFGNFAGGASITATTNILDWNWHHIAVCRSGSTTRLFIDGVDEANTTSDYNTDSANALTIPGMYDYTNGTTVYYHVGGFMDNFRFYSNYAKYTANFTPSATDPGLSTATDLSWRHCNLALDFEGANNSSTFNIYAPAKFLYSGMNLTANNTAYSSFTDSPSNYGTDTGRGAEVRGTYCQLNPWDAGSGAGYVYYGGQATEAEPSFGFKRGTFSVNSGKWYYEYTSLVSYSGYSQMVGWCSWVSNSYNYAADNVFMYDRAGYRYFGATNGTPYGNSWTTGDVIGVALDLDNGAIYFSKNGVWQYNGATQGDPTSGASKTGAANSVFVADYFEWIPCNLHSYSGGGPYGYCNFGQRPYKYWAPAGYKSLCTTNLPHPRIKDPSQLMAATYYGGTGTQQEVSVSTYTGTGAKFKPDLIWIKDRSYANGHIIIDSARGVSNVLNSTTTAIATTVTNGVVSINSAGFAVGTSNNFNRSGTAYIAWQWKEAPGIFDIVEFQGTSTTPINVAHNLATTPQFMIVKSYTGTANNWLVYHHWLAAGTTGLALEQTAAAGTDGRFWGNTYPNTTHFSVGSYVGAGRAVAYLWREIPGFSKFGFYIGNGNSLGHVIPTGFRPRYVLIKNYNVAGNWSVHDSSRLGSGIGSGYYANPYNYTLYPNLVNSEQGYVQVYLNANGFRLAGTNSDWNTSGQTYLFVAFAESPFKYARAR